MTNLRGLAYAVEIGPSYDGQLTPSIVEMENFFTLSALQDLSIGAMISGTQLSDVLQRAVEILPLMRRFTCLVDFLSAQTLEIIAQRMPMLEDLVLRDQNMPILESHNDIGDGTLQFLSHHCGQLKSLYLARTEGIFSCSDVGAIFVAIMCVNMESITLSCMPKLSDSTLCAYLKCINLRQLHLQRCTDLTGDAFYPAMCGRQNIPTLTVLNLSQCRNLGDDAVAAACELAPNLVELNLAGTSVSDECMPAIGSLRQLRVLVLNGCDITNTGLRALIVARDASINTVNKNHHTEPTFARFTKLALRNCPETDDDGWLSLSPWFATSIVCLDLTGVIHLSNAALLTILGRTCSLEELKLRNCFQITSDTLRSIICTLEHLRRRLRVLDLTRCDGIHSELTCFEDSQGRLLLPKLTQLSVGWSGLRRDAVMWFAFRHPTVKLLHLDVPCVWSDEC